MNIFTQLLSVLDLVHIPDKKYSHPFGNEVSDTVTKPKTAKVNTPKPRYTNGELKLRVPVYENINGDGWDSVGKMQINNRDSSISNRDIEEIESRSLKEDRYQEIKLRWANYESIREISNSYKGQRGYGKRTIEKYIAAINRANPSPE